jgi:PilZ domain
LAIEHPRERRGFGRRSVFKPAVIELDDGRRIDGAVLDISDGGAKVRLTDPEALKGEFYLEMPGDDLIIRCRCARIENGIAGIEFVKPPRRLSWVKK